MNRMNREQFFAKLAPLDEAGLRKTLWSLYWRGTAAVRERIEAEIEPSQTPKVSRAAPVAIDGEFVLHEVRDFVSLARSGACLGGTRLVSPKERTNWRHTFSRLVTDARDALSAEDPTPGAAAVEAIIDLAMEMRGVDYFRSDDPVEAARLVVSDEVARMWARLLDHNGFPAFAKQAAAQLIRWESKYGWTRRGWGKIPEKETSLASVLARMLKVPDAWLSFADCYLDALDQFSLSRSGAPKQRPVWGSSGDYERDRRTADLAEWHGLLLTWLPDDAGDNRFDRLTNSRALGGPELTFVKARLAYQRGELSKAHTFMHECLTELPGHHLFLEFATEIGAPLPPRAQEVVGRNRTLPTP